MSETIVADRARRSDAIAIARVICILGVVYVHAWTGLNGIALAALRGTGQDTLRWTLMEVFGRSAEANWHAGLALAFQRASSALAWWLGAQQQPAHWHPWRTEF